MVSTYISQLILQLQLVHIPDTKFTAKTNCYMPGVKVNPHSSIVRPHISAHLTFLNILFMTSH